MQQMAIAVAVLNAFNKDTITAIVEASKASAVATAKAKDDRKAGTETGTTLFQTLKEAALETVEHDGWGRKHFEAVMGFAVEQGANEESLRQYGSLFGSYIEATQRKENPISLDTLKAEKVTVKQVRDAIRTPDDQEKVELVKSIRSSMSYLNPVELRKLEKDLYALTLARRNAAEAKKAERDAKKLAAKAAEAAAGEIKPGEVGSDIVAGQERDNGNGEQENEAKAA